MNEPVRDRFCENEVWHNDCRFGPCGGETRYAQRLEGGRIVTYLRCVFCGHAVPMLEVHLDTRELVKVGGE